jgi:hypothetical protein
VLPAAAELLLEVADAPLQGGRVGVDGDGEQEVGEAAAHDFVVLCFLGRRLWSRERWLAKTHNPTVFLSSGRVFVGGSGSGDGDISHARLRPAASLSHLLLDHALGEAVGHVGQEEREKGGGAHADGWRAQGSLRK